MPETSQSVILKFEHLPAVSYALYQNQVPVIRSFVINNNSEQSFHQLAANISPVDGFAESLELIIGDLGPGSTFQPEKLRLKINPEFINSLTEKLTSSIKITIREGDTLIHEESFEIDILAYNQWLGKQILPEMLSAFVMPNLPGLVSIQKNTSVYLDKWTANPSLDEYQSQNPDRVKKQSAAVYEAIKDQNIVYCTLPASYGSPGQRVRLPDEVLATKLGNCLEMSLLYASCIEAIGLHPILVIIKGHAFVGTWLINESFPDPVNDDPTLLTKRMASGINELLLLEATAMNDGQSLSFDDALKAATNHLNNIADFEYFIDVFRSRFSGIRPMPLRIPKDHGWQIEEPPEKEKTISQSGNPESLVWSPTIEEEAQVQYSKQQLWERKLLDLSLRNNLLNLRITKSTLQFIPVPLDELEDKIAEGIEFQIYPRPQDWDNPLRSAGVYQALDNSGPILSLVKEELKQKRLRVYLTEENLNAGLLDVYRKSKQALEENGANILYMAIGLLKWYETPASEQPRFAPILLLPVEIIRRTVSKGFIIRGREEDTLLNVTLLEKLRQDFGIGISGLETLPTDQSGVDVKLIFTILRKAIMSMPRWDIEEQIFLGTFSFNKFIMWNDIHSNSKKLIQHPIIEGFVKGHLEKPLAFSESKNLDEDSGFENLFLPIGADSSQFQAILAAVNGESFVLHGPPGTGKSQTITNMIANALYAGKRVLFVAEKMAALSVVQDRLERIGLSPFCLELHSNKARKSEVLLQLQNTMEVTRIASPESFAEDAKRLDDLRSELNQYIKLLHKKQSYGLSLFDLFNKYISLANAKDEIEFNRGYLSVLNTETLHQWVDVIEELQIAAQLAGNANQTHPLFGFEPKEYNNQSKDLISDKLSKFIDTRRVLANQLSNVCGLLNLTVNEWNSKRLNNLSILLKSILSSTSVPEPFFKINDISELSNRLNPLLDIGAEKEKAEEELLQQFVPRILEVEADNLLGEWNRASSKWFLPKYFSHKKIRTFLSGYLKNGKLESAQIPQILLKNISIAEKRRTIENDKEYLVQTLGRQWKQGKPDWNKLKEEVINFQSLNQSILNWSQDRDIGHSLRKRIGSLIYQEQNNFLETGSKTFESFIETIGKELHARNQLELLLNNTLPYETTNGNDEYIDKAEKWNDNLGGLKNWYHWIQIRTKVKNLNLDNVIEAYEKENFSTETILKNFQKSLYRSLADMVIENDQQLSSFSGQYFNTRIAKFRELIKTFATLTQKVIFAKLASGIPQFTHGSVATSEAGILQRAIRSKGRGLSIRNLFSSIPNLLPMMAPCMLMSPISVAQYLDLNTEPFDLIIFDEASQLSTSEAVGTIARGKAVIVVGDPKQMPPTNFFSSVHFDEEDSNEDLESILDDCLALSVPSRQLKWHYRSQHESLIAFSNAQYYDNSLLTFPSPDDLATRVHYFHIDGVYERGKSRQNHAEARAIVKEVVRLLSLPSDERKSIGVVTFSIVQQMLIEDMIYEEFAKNPILEEHNNQSSEPIFIKNLENVQGDERDIILFSICYGPDENGNVALNFGPLNREGGWRRLNVAVSRARYAMSVYSTLRSDQIDLSRTRSKGVEGLKAFLAYAEKGKVALPIPVRSQSMSLSGETIETAVAQFLQSHGYAIDSNIGTSGFHIDIAVINPGNKSEYLAGIQFDGTNFLSGKNAIDRNIVQPSVLDNLGWKVFRIWAVDWWENRDSLRENLLSFLKDVSGNSTSGPVRNEEVIKPDERHNGHESIIQPDSELPQPSLFPNDKIPEPGPINKTIFYEPKVSGETSSIYQTAALEPMTGITYEDFLFDSSTQKVQQQILEVIETEAPIYKDLVCRRVLESWGITKKGTRIVSRFDEIFDQMNLITTKEENDDICYWSENQDPDDYNTFRLPKNINERRPAEEIPPHEVANAVRKIVSEQISLPGIDLMREVAKLFQYARLGPNVEASMRQGIQKAIQQEKVKEENGRIIRNSKNKEI